MNVSLVAESLRGEFQLPPRVIEFTASKAGIVSEQDYSEREKKFISELTEDGRWVFSGMIYGYVATWIPASDARGVEEEFEIRPIAQISPGDERLKMLSIDEIDGMVYVLMEYTCDSTQQKRLEAWKSSLFSSVTGEGSSPIWDGSRRRAFEMAIREAMKNHFRRKEFNQPKRIQAKVALAGFPLVGFGSGTYRALVSIRVGPSKVEHYKID